jgi:DNA-binding SARP family transcriptional activator
MRISMLGEFLIEIKNKKFLQFPTQKAVSLIAFLITNSGKTYSREFLAEMLWTDRPAEKARHSLLTAFWQIRNALRKGGLEPEQLIQTTATKVRWVEPGNLDLDVREFEDAVKENTVSALEKAVALYRGPFLSDIYDDWCIQERYRLETLYQQTLTGLISQQIKTNQYGSAINNALRLVLADRLNENAHQALIFCYYQQGNRSSAIEQYEECTRLLKDELGIAPSAETQKLYQDVIQEKIPQHYKKVFFETEAPQEVLIPNTSMAAVEDKSALFIGRDGEMQMLLDWWENRNEICAYIKGPQGTGKSKLARVVANRIKTQNVVIGWGKGNSTEQDVPNYAFFTALRKMLAQIPAPIRSNLPKKLVHLLSQYIPEIDEEHAAKEFLPEQSQVDFSRLFFAVGQLIVYIAKHQPILLVIDDLQWATEPGVRLLEYLVRFVEAEKPNLKNKVKILFTGPCETMISNHVARMLMRLQKDHLVLDLPLQNLSREAVEQWLKEWSKRDSSILPFVDLLYKQLKGNPYLIREMISSLFDNGLLTNTEAGWEGDILTKMHLRLPVPSSIVKQVESEIRGLSSNAVELVRAAAVAGEEFNLLVLQKVLKLDDSSLFNAAEDLIRRQFISETEEKRPYDLEFSHYLFREVVYQQVSFIRRSSIHRRIAQVLEDEWGDSAASSILYHYHQASDHLNATNWAIKAGQQAMARYAYQEAEQLLVMAEDISSQANVSDATREKIWDLLYKLHLKTGNKEKKQFYDEKLHASSTKDKKFD